MSFTQSTVLGRRVRLDDWLSFHRDRLLVTLYSMRDAGDEDGLTIQQISSITGLDVLHTCDLVESMKTKPKLIKSTIRNTVTITGRGIRWVEESPHSP